eukprot:2271400-Prymnesium_polylepis.1
MADGSTLVSVAEMRNAHRASVWSVAFSPDGTKIVSGSMDQSIKLWGVLLAPAHASCSSDGSTLTSVAAMPNAHSDYVSSVAFSPDGTKIVSGSYDYSIKLWGVLPCTHKLHLLSVACLNGVVAGVWYEQLLALACVRLWQMDQPWHLWQRCPMRTAATFTQWPSHRMAPRLCPALMTKASSFGVCHLFVPAALAECGCGWIVGNCRSMGTGLFVCMCGEGGGRGGATGLQNAYFIGPTSGHTPLGGLAMCVPNAHSGRAYQIIGSVAFSPDGTRI